MYINIYCWVYQCFNVLEIKLHLLNIYFVLVSASMFLFFLGAGGSDSGRLLGGRRAGVIVSGLFKCVAWTGSGYSSVGFPSGKCWKTQKNKTIQYFSHSYLLNCISSCPRTVFSLPYQLDWLESHSSLHIEKYWTCLIQNFIWSIYIHI